MKFFSKSLPILLLILGLSTISNAQTISIDEDFSDWENVPAFYEDPSGDNLSTDIDFSTIKIINDDRFIYLYLELGTESLLQQNNTISLLIDTDSNPETGEIFENIGYEFLFNFWERSGQYFSDGETSFTSYTIGLVSAPTVTSSTFEIVFDRNAVIDGESVFTSDSFDIIIRSHETNGDLVPDSGEKLTYSFDNEATYTPEPYSLNKINPSDLRVMSYNVLRDAIFDPSNKDFYKRIFQAIDPDIIGFEEIYDHSAQEVAALIEGFLPSEEGEEWYHGDVGNDNLMVSRYPVINETALSGNAAYLLDLGDRKLLTVVAHPPCCSNDANRQSEIDQFMGFIRDSKSGGGFDIEENTPIVVMGDMNMVGLAQQQTTLLEGDIVNEESSGPDFNPDWDGTPFEDSKPANPGLPTTFTWYNSGSAFGAGRLDYMVYTGSVLEMTNNFSLHTMGMQDDSLAIYSLEKNDTFFASDHLPLVTDFQFKALTSSEINKPYPASFELFQNYPNPFNPTTTIQFRIHESNTVTLEVFDFLGRKISTLINEQKSVGLHAAIWDTNTASSGVYYYRIQVGDVSEVRKMILLK